MPFSAKPKTSAYKSFLKSTALLALISVTFAFAGAFVHVRHSFSAGETLSNKTVAPRNANAAPTPPPASIPVQVPANRFKYGVNETRDMPIATGVDSFIVVSPDIVDVRIKNRYTLTLTGKTKGETILIISFGARRQTFIIEVAGRPPMSERAKALAADQAEKVPEKTTGFLETAYTQGFGQSPSILRSTIDIRRKMSGDRTLRVGGETFKAIGGGNANQAFVSGQDFGFNRIALGVDTPKRSIDILDSQVNLSTSSLNNYTMRGFHLSDIPKASVNGAPEKKGLEVFAGFSRPSFSLFDSSGGKLAGVIVPVASGDTWQVRGGVIAVSPDKNYRRNNNGGVIGQVIAAFTPNKNISVDGEIAFSRGDLSGRARVDLKFDRFGGTAEITRLAISSPLSSIGAQAGGRSSESFSAYWRPTRRLGGSIGYNHTGVRRLINSQLSDFDRTAMYATANWRVNKAIGFNFRYLDQKIDTSIAGAASTFKIATRTFTFGNNIRLSRSWSNNFNARLIYSREMQSAEGLEAGFNFSEQLRYNSRGKSVTGFINYNKRSPSLVNLILRNPSLLPAQLQPIFLLDPALFLQTYRDRLNTLLYGIELPQTANLDAGVRFQTSVSRFTIAGETRYSKSEYISSRQNSINASMAVNVRLDNANSLQFTGWRGFGSSSQSSFTISYRHTFGTEGGGFRFGDLIGLNRGKVEGRVYNDLNGNGEDDKEPGIAGMTIELGKGRTARTDADGRYRFSAGEGHYDLTLVSDSLGLRLRGSTATERHIRLRSGRTETASFGLMDSGFVSGKIFNITTFTGTLPRLKGIKVSIRSADKSTGGILQQRITDGNGAYDFPNLRPGKYTLSIDPYSLPLDVSIPPQTTWELIVLPLQGNYFDIPLQLQQAVPRGF